MITSLFFLENFNYFMEVGSGLSSSQGSPGPQTTAGVLEEDVCLLH